MNVKHDTDDFKNMYDDLIHERDKLLHDLHDLRLTVQHATLKDHDQKRQIDENKEQISILEGKLAQEKNANIRELKIRARIELELQMKTKIFEKNDVELALQKALLDNQKQEFDKLKIYVRKLEEEKIHLEKNNEIFQVKYDNAYREFNKYAVTYERLTENQSSYINELKQKNNEILQLQKQCNNERKKKDHVDKSLQLVRNQINELEQQREDLYLDILESEQKLNIYKKIEIENRQQFDKLIRERENLNRTCQRLLLKNRKQVEESKKIEKTNIILQQDIINYQEALKEQRKIFAQLEKERNRYMNDVSRLQNEIVKIMDEVKKKEPELYQQRHIIKELKTKLTHTKTFNETLTADRNLHLRRSTKYLDEMNDMQRKLDKSIYQIDQLKDDIHDKNQELVEGQNAYENIRKEKKQFVFTIEHLKTEIKTKDEINKNRQVEYEKLNKSLSLVIEERDQKTKLLQQAIAERNIIGAQLVRRNDELALLYEKLKIQKTTLTNGELQYKARLEDIRILKFELKKLVHEKSILSDKLSKTDELKREFFRSQRDLIRERTHCHQLEEELENPMNIHRWRQLEGSDPSKFELIQKIQFLQKRLIHKTEEVAAKELFIQEKEKLYMTLKSNLARQPNEESTRQLSMYQEALQATTKQLKSLICEVNMYESQIDGLKNEIHKQHRQLTELRQKFSLRKRKENLVETHRVIATPNAIPSSQQSRVIHMKTIGTHDQTRFNVGRFNLRPRLKVSSVTNSLIN